MLSNFIDIDTPMKSTANPSKKDTKLGYEKLAAEASKEAVEAFRREYDRTLMARKIKRS